MTKGIDDIDQTLRNQSLEEPNIVNEADEKGTSSPLIIAVPIVTRRAWGDDDDDDDKTPPPPLITEIKPPLKIRLAPQRMSRPAGLTNNSKKVIDVDDNDNDGWHTVRHKAPLKLSQKKDIKNADIELPKENDRWAAVRQETLERVKPSFPSSSSSSSRGAFPRTQKDYNGELGATPRRGGKWNDDGENDSKPHDRKFSNKTSGMKHPCQDCGTMTIGRFCSSCIEIFKSKQTVEKKCKEAACTNVFYGSKDYCQPCIAAFISQPKKSCATCGRETALTWCLDCKRAYKAQSAIKTNKDWE